MDFDRISTGGPRFSVGAVNVRTANFVYFDSTAQRIRPEHIIASGSLPPGFPATEIDGEYYVLERPDPREGVRTFDLFKNGSEKF